MFRNYGDYWRIAYKGKILSVRNTKGLVYIGHLLHRPEERIHSYELSGLTESDSTSVAALGEDTPERDEAMERARKAVTNRIRDSIERIAKQHPFLGRHLNNALQTGTYCSYRPEVKTLWTA